MKLTDRSVRALKPENSRYEKWIDGHKGFGVRVSPEGTKSWIFMYRYQGKLRRMTLGRYPVVGVARANRLHAGALETLERGIDPAKEAIQEHQQERAASKERTVKAIYESFAADHLTRLRTGEEVKRKFEVDILPHWGRRRVDEITRSDIRALLREKAKDSPIAANRLLAAIKKYFNWAIDEEIIQSSPAIRIPPLVDERQRARDRVLTESEIRVIWQAAEKMGHPFGDIVRMLFLTAARRGEIGGMTWPETDFDEGLWRLPASRYKTQRAHVLPLVPAAMDILVERYEHDRNLVREDSPMPAHVFRSGRTGDNPVKGHSKARLRLDLLIEEAGEEVPGWHLHDIRRTAATHMRQGGADRLTVQKILGHSDRSMTGLYDKYGSLPEMRRALETWATRLAIIIAGDGGGKVVPIRSAE